MVGPNASLVLAKGFTLLERLSPLNQIRAVVGLVVVLVLGLVMLLFIKAGARMVRGLSSAANRLPERTLPDDDDWAREPLTPPINDDA